MIRKLNMNVDEINKVMTILKKADIDAHRFISEEYWLENYNVVKEEYIPIAETYVCVEQNEIKGFISILDGGYIGALFVDMDSQGNGIGRKLIDYTKEKYDKLILAVYKENKKAVGFYKKVGFVVRDQCLDEETEALEYIMSFEIE